MTKQKEVDIILFSVDMRKLFGRHRIVMQRYYYRETDSDKPCMASFWIRSHIIILYAIYIYMFMLYLYSPFFSSNTWIWITVHVNSRLQSIAYR